MNAILNDQKTLQAIQRVKQAIEDIKQGKMVVMVDDEDRENEGDLVYAAQFSTPEKVNFMASHAKGLICVTVTEKIAGRLELTPMVKNNDSSYETAFTVSVDAKSSLTGISAMERDMTINILADTTATSSELVRPGHIFPLIAKEGGSLVRIGHTEGSVDLCKLAGLNESAVICEIMKDDGTMARRPDLDIFCDKNELNIVAISDIVEYRMMHESLIRLEKETMTEFMGTPAYKYDILDNQNKHHIVYTFGEIKERSVIKFHSMIRDHELFSDTNKYNHFIDSINYVKEKAGVLIFMDHEACNMSQIREYGIGAQIIKQLGIQEIELITNTSAKEFIGINGFGLSIVDNINVKRK